VNTNLSRRSKVSCNRYSNRANVSTHDTSLRSVECVKLRITSPFKTAGSNSSPVNPRRTKSLDSRAISNGSGPWCEGMVEIYKARKAATKTSVSESSMREREQGRRSPADGMDRLKSLTDLLV